MIWQFIQNFLDSIISFALCWHTGKEAAMYISTEVWLHSALSRQTEFQRELIEMQGFMARKQIGPKAKFCNGSGES